MAEILGKSTLDAKQRRGVTVLRQSAEHLLQIVNEILDVSKTESGTVELCETEFDALELVEETNGRSIEPQLLEERARLAELLGDDAACERGLRDAQRLYVEIGAGGHAERLAEELGL